MHVESLVTTPNVLISSEYTIFLHEVALAKTLSQGSQGTLFSVSGRSNVFSTDFYTAGDHFSDYAYKRPRAHKKSEIVAFFIVLQVH